MKKNKLDTFIASIFFVLGFSLVFSILGILLQTVLAGIGYQVKLWFMRLGGIIIVFFGLYLTDLLKIPFLEREKRINIKKKFSSRNIGSFIFGAAFALGWSPCIGAVLGSILTLAITTPTSAFILLLSYSFGLGIPFLLVGLFTNEAKKLIKKSGKWLLYLRRFFGIILIILGFVILFNKLAYISRLSFASELMVSLDGSLSGGPLTIGIAFLAGIVSFLSPCILPMVPAYLSYIASIGGKRKA